MPDVVIETHNEEVQGLKDKMNELFQDKKLSDVISASSWMLLDALAFAYNYSDIKESQLAIKSYFIKLHLAFDEMTNKVDEERTAEKSVMN